MSERGFSATSRIIFILVLFFSFNNSNGQNPSPAPPCPSSSCGHIINIHYPFRLKSYPEACGYNRNTTYFELDCENNQAILAINSKRYFVQNINYSERSIRLVEASINRSNSSSCPLLYSTSNNDWPSTLFDGFSDINVQVAFIHCLSPVNSVQYVEAPFCGNRSNIFSNSSEFHSYVMVGGVLVSDLDESCTVDRVGWASVRRPMKDDSSLTGIYNGLNYGFELSWCAIIESRGFNPICDQMNVTFRFEGNIISCQLICTEVLSFYEFGFKRQLEYVARAVGFYVGSLTVGMMALRFIFGFPLFIWLVVYKWRRRHLSMDKGIEEFLRSQNNLMPIQYTHAEIKRMTNNFTQKLGEGAYGIVYKGKLRSGLYVAIKMMEQSMSSEEEFISEVGTIGRIHHANIVQLIGFCVERPTYTLVYEYLPNGSLDKYLFYQQSMDPTALTYEKMVEIALGVAHGIGYLHQGCDIQILHFDIKPHNILLDEKFNPKISDFGLAQLHPRDESFINLTGARGTMGYMAPEMFYKNLGGISYKADVYSYGMLLMEIASRSKNMNSFIEDMSQIHFPSWVYDQLRAGNDIEVIETTKEERKILRKIIIVALWCIQMRPSNRPSMNKVVEMLESDCEPQMPSRPFVAPHEIAVDDHQILTTYSVDYINLGLGEN